MEGLNGYRSAIAPLLFGANHPALVEGRIATVQTLGGSGALKIGIHGETRAFKDSDVVFPGWIADPHLGLREIRFQEVSTDF